MRVLAVDTATPYLVLGTPEAELVLRAERRHNELLVPVLTRFLERSGLALKELEGVVAGQGPGSYTGLRVGLAFAQGLARALGVPFVGVDTLAGVAARYRHGGRVAVGLSSRNRLVYAALYDGDARLRGPEKLTAEAFAALAPCRVLDAPPSGRALARLGAQALTRGARGFHAHYL